MFLFVVAAHVAEIETINQPKFPVTESIVVNATRETPLAASFETRHGLSEEDIAAAAAVSADEIVTLLPSAHLPVNSRGEAIVFLRNASERQVGVFYDGAAINIPWDNRLDLSLIPTGLIGGARLASGPLAPHYGVNALGAVNFVPRTAFDGGRASVSYGSGEHVSADAFVPLLDENGAGLAIGGGVTSRDGVPLSHKADLPYSQSSGDIRTNTDRELANGFLRAHLERGDHRFSFTALHVEGEKGIAPESDRPGDDARFWRYPDVTHTLGVFNAELNFGAAARLDGALWVQRFGQTIDAYTGDDYRTVDSREVDRDITYGVRQILSHETDRAKFVGSVSYLDAKHRQRDIDFDMGALPAVLPEELDYRQRNLSIGGEMEVFLAPGLIAEAGAGFDRVAYVETGDKPPLDEFSGWNGRIGIVYDAGDGWLLRAAAGRKLRTPTMRELFGQALNRFLINPDLQPERILSAEVAAEWRGEGGGFYVIPFIQDLDGTIDQQQAGSLRQRINLEGSRVIGVEAGGEVALTPALKLSGAATYSDVERKGAGPGETDKIAEKPELIARASAQYRHASGFGAAVEVEHLGRAYSADLNGDLVPLKRSTALNMRLSYAMDFGATQSELFLNLDNITDAYVLPQAGLPAPGRMIRGGVRLAW